MEKGAGFIYEKVSSEINPAPFLRSNMPVDAAV
jgi:hypothetical protein